MEQTTQQITQKPSIPIKTKIAGWWIILIGIIILGYSIKLLFVLLPLVHESVLSCQNISSTVNPNIENDFKIKILLTFAFILFLALFLFVLVWYLFRAKKWAWIGLFILSLTPVVFLIFCLVGFLKNASSPHNYAFPVASVMCTPSYLLLMELEDRFPIFLVTIASFFIPLILLSLDRKNFFKIAS